MTRTLPTDTPRKSVTRVGTLRISARSLKRVTCPSLGERRTWRRLLPRDTSWRRNAGGVALSLRAMPTKAIPTSIA